MGKTLRLILGDQLNNKHSWLEQVRDDVTYVMMEMRQETDYVAHHIQKVVGFFAAMRKFSANLSQMGHQVIYLQLDTPTNTQSLTANLSRLIEEHSFERFEYQLPDEYRLDQLLHEFVQTLDIPWEAVDTEHFITKRDAVLQHFGRKNFLMESFYRQIRKDHGWLMEDGQPIGGQWNYDKENRKSLPKGKRVVKPKVFSHDVSEITEMIQNMGVATIGTIDPQKFIWPLDRGEGMEVLDFFLQSCLSDFGNYQDAMAKGEWSMFHSRISFALNTKMIAPKEVIDKVIQYAVDQPEISLAAVEGFVRQIAGWREFIRGVYWAKMPAYASTNYFGHTRTLPKYFWSGKTKMACMQDAIGQSLERAYAHHIQRLMITGNFALLAQINPDEVDQWYLGIYIDAIEWVEMPNTRGMSQFADGGVLATKPYISSANYIQKMGNYCTNCAYDPKKKTGENACPFNSLYWNFLLVNQETLSKNGRMNMMYAQLNKMDSAQKSELMKQAAYYLENIESL